MARVEQVDSDSSEEVISKSEKKAQSPSKGNKAAKVDNKPDNASSENGEEQEDEEEEEEYEIEEIIDAKRGTFPRGRLGYLVKWKGYDSSHNSWVDEKDAGNAEILIDAFWKSSKKERGRKSLDTKTKSIKVGKPPKDDVPEPASASAAKKRGRSKGKQEKEDNGGSDEESEPAPKKKPRKSNGADAKPRKSAAGKKTAEVTPDREDEDMIDDTPIGNMDDYRKVPSWEHLVEEIDTVERTAKGNLDVYFRLISGERIKEDARTCALRFPQKLISFYESNLRWKVTDP